MSASFVMANKKWVRCVLRNCKKTRVHPTQQSTHTHASHAHALTACSALFNKRNPCIVPHSRSSKGSLCCSLNPTPKNVGGQSNHKSTFNPQPLGRYHPPSLSKTLCRLSLSLVKHEAMFLHSSNLPLSQNFDTNSQTVRSVPSDTGV